LTPFISKKCKNWDIKLVDVVVNEKLLAS